MYGIIYNILFILYFMNTGNINKKNPFRYTGYRHTAVIYWVTIFEY